MSAQYEPGNYNKSGMIAFIFSMVATVVFFIYVAFIHSGVDLKEIPKDENMKAGEMSSEAGTDEMASEEDSEDTSDNSDTEAE